MDLEHSQEPDPDLLGAGGHSEGHMEQPPGQEGTGPAPAPCRAQSIPQTLQEDTVPGGSQQPAGDRTTGGRQEAVGGDRTPGGRQEAVGGERTTGGRQEAVGGDRTPAASQDTVAPDGQRAVPRGIAQEVPLPCPPDAHPQGGAEVKPSEARGSLGGTAKPSLGPGGHSPGGQSPGGHSPGGHSSGGQSPRVPSPGGQSPGAHSPGGPRPGAHSPVGQSPGGPSPGGPSPGGPSPGRQAEEDFYCVKWIRWKGERTPVITQSQNGPCPLLAIMNILFLQWKVKLPPQKEVITAEELMAHLGDCILATQPREPSEGLQLNFQQNINDAMMVLPKLSTGLDVNVRFTGVSDFEYTPECIIFDLLNLPLYHGWLVDPQTPEVVQAVGKLSYNQLVEKIITCKQQSDSSLVSEGLVAEQFLESTASQLTFHGLCELAAATREGELSVFFRNNHFSTMTKHQGHLYLLVTDQGFLQEEGVVWESLHTVDGDSCFCDTDFHLSHPPGKEGTRAGSPQQRQMDQDYLMALTLQQQQGQDPSALSDLELAQQLQQEEYQQQQPQPPPPLPPQQVPTQARGRAERRQRQRPDLDCSLL